MIKKISFIGSGNVAWGLAPFFGKRGVEIAEVFSTNPESSLEFSKQFNCKLTTSLPCLDKISDLYLIAVPDREIVRLTQTFPQVNGIVAHTSGIVSIKALNKFNRYGVFYPLQSFTKALIVDISKVPFCIEASNTQVEDELILLGSELSNNVQLINSEQRKELHLSAVLVNNFTNLLYSYADEILEKKDIDFQLLLPLLEETVRKVKLIKPREAQTGPAKRNDQVTIEEHLKMLNEFPEIQKLYKLFSEQIRAL